jgi:acyl carrier protein
MDTMRDDIAAKIKGFVESRQRVAAGDERFTLDVHLFEAGYIDSIGMVELVAFVEETFDITFDEDQLFSDDFTSINGIARMVEDTLEGRGAA